MFVFVSVFYFYFVLGLLLGMSVVWYCGLGCVLCVGVCVYGVDVIFVVSCGGGVGNVMYMCVWLEYIVGFCDLEVFYDMMSLDSGGWVEFEFSVYFFSVWLLLMFYGIGMFKLCMLSCGIGLGF